jgi:hypothetical protein
MDALLPIIKTNRQGSHGINIATAPWFTAPDSGNRCMRVASTIAICWAISDGHVDRHSMDITTVYRNAPVWRNRNSFNVISTVQGS